MHSRNRKTLTWQNHRIIEQAMLEGTSKGHQVEAFWEEVKLFGTLPNCIMKISSDGNSAISLGKLFQQLTVPIVKNFFLISRQDLSWCSLVHCLLSKDHNTLLSLSFFFSSKSHTIFFILLSSLWLIWQKLIFPNIEVSSTLFLWLRRKFFYPLNSSPGQYSVI